jgi:hypothetical protein
MPIHGPGYGLDEREAFLSLIGGLIDAAMLGEAGAKLQSIEIVERNAARCERLSRILEANIPALLPEEMKPVSSKSSPVSLVVHLDQSEKRARHKRGAAAEVEGSLRMQFEKFGRNVENRIRLFTAMPFKEDYRDEWEISISEAAHANDIICERMDEQAFVGDILLELKRRIEKYDGLIAVLNDANPNVFLEIGYAWANDKPTILVIKRGQEPPFDVRGHKCVIYTGIADLRTKLRDELGLLKANGIFDH